MENLTYYIKQTLVNELKINQLNNLQKAVIPLIEKNQNIVLTSSTGTGKTLCYLIPILNLINFNLNQIQAVIIAPTKELVNQISNVLSFFKKNKNEIKYLTISNFKHKVKFDNLYKNNNQPQIVICTPFLFCELSKLKNNTKELKAIVLDEADMCLDLGFFKEINIAFSNLKNLKQIKKIATSASLHESLANQIKKFFKNALFIDKTNKNIWVNKNITHYLIHYPVNLNKIDVLKKVIKLVNPYYGLIFCNTKKSVDLVYEDLYQNDFVVVKLHGGIEKRKRKNIIKTIKSQATNLAVVSDLVARGIDVENITDVFSYELPKEMIWYLHRSGRTGRKNNKGNSYVFYEEKNNNLILSLIKKGIKFNHLKLTNNQLVDYNYKIKQKEKKQTEIDIAIKKVVSIANANKKVKPNYKKKTKLKIKAIKKKARKANIKKIVKTNKNK